MAEYVNKVELLTHLKKKKSFGELTAKEAIRTVEAEQTIDIAHCSDAGLEKERNKMKANDVIQANEKSGEWCGCLLIVTETYKWGVMAGMKVPGHGTTYIRLNNEQFDFIGEAALAERKE